MTKLKLYFPKEFVLAFCAVAAAFAACSTAQAQTGPFWEGPSGGTGGAAFLDEPPALPGYINYIRVRSGAVVDAIQTFWLSASGGSASPQHGGNGGHINTFDLAAGEFVNYVYGYAGAYIDSIGFCTTAHRCSPLYGGNGGVYGYSYEAPPGYEIIGFRGRSGAYLDNIGVIIRKR